MFFCFSLGLANPDEIRAVTLTWSEDAATTQTVAWQTEPGSPHVFVEYIEANAPDAETSAPRRARASTAAFVTDDGQAALHTAVLRGLKPASRYAYRIGDGNKWIKEGVFLTEDARNGFKFLLFGDSQSTDYRVWQTTFERAVQRNPDARFFVNAGDLVDNGQTNREWKSWHQAVGRYAARLPVMPVVGNHETYTPERAFSLPRFFTAQFFVPQNGPEGMKGQVYSFDYGNAHFVVLDSQIGEERSFLPDSLALQQAWLAADLAATKQRWKVVFLHRPPYHNRAGESSPDAHAAGFVPIFDRYGVDAVFSGHDHVNARTARMTAGAADPRGTVYATVGRSGTKVYQAMERKPWNAQFANPQDAPTYTVVQAAGGLLYVRVFLQSGELLDEWSLTKLQPRNASAAEADEDGLK